MKKLAMSIAVILLMGTTAFAQDGGGALKRSKEYRENYRITTRNGGMMIPGLPEFESDTDQDAPLGSGMAVLLGLGAAYLVGKRRKEE